MSVENITQVSISSDNQYLLNPNDTTDDFEVIVPISQQFAPYYTHVAVTQVQIPRSWLNIRDTDTFTIYGVIEGINYNRVISVDAANYNFSTLKNAIENNPESKIIAVTPNGNYYFRWRFDLFQDTGKCEFSVEYYTNSSYSTRTNANNTHTHYIRTSFDSNLSEALGLEVNVPISLDYDSTVLPNSEFTGQSTNVCDLQNENIVYIHSNICKNNNNGTTQSNDILAVVYMGQVAPYSYGNFSYGLHENERMYANQGAFSNRYKFYLRNQHNKPLTGGLGGLPINMQLTLYTRFNNSFLYTELKLQNSILMKMLEEMVKNNVSVSSNLIPVDVRGLPIKK